MFKQLDTRALEQHVTILGWILIVTSALLLVIAGFMFVFFTGIGAVAQDATALAVLTLIATVFGAFLAILALPGILAGYGLLKRQAWGRYLALVVSVLNLMNVPLGTLIGLYGIWVLMQESAAEYFAPRTALVVPSTA
jgi:hypothetical protein